DPEGAAGGWAHGFEGGESEERRRQAGAAAVDGEAGLKKLDAERGDGGSERQREKESAEPAGSFEPEAQAEEDGEVGERHPAGPVHHLGGQQTPDLTARDPGSVVLQQRSAAGQ